MEGLHGFAAARPPPPMQLDHIGIALPDTAPLAALLAGQGLTCLGHGASGPEPQVGYPGLGATWAVYGRARQRPWVLLLAPTCREGAVGRFLARHGPRVQHIAFAVGDLGRAARDLAARGARAVRDHPGRSYDGRRALFLHPAESGGVLIELVERDGGGAS
jgi:methylmalonyl-CoA/ethylmalonyl-CoA epimerase